MPCCRLNLGLRGKHLNVVAGGISSGPSHGRALAHLRRQLVELRGRGGQVLFGGLVGGNIHPLRQLEDFVLANPVGQGVGKLP